MERYLIGKVGSGASFLESAIQPSGDVSCDVEDPLLPHPERAPWAHTALAGVPTCQGMQQRPEELMEGRQLRVMPVASNEAGSAEDTTGKPAEATVFCLSSFSCE